jgi:hypothetical protein
MDTATKISRTVYTTSKFKSQVTITGANFGATQGDSSVTFNGVSAGVAANWSDTSITLIVPSGAGTGNVVVTVAGQSSAGAPFTVLVPPGITSIWPASGPVGTSVTITGTGFGVSQGTSTVAFGGVPAATIPFWSATSITAIVPGGAITGSVAVTVTGMTGTGDLFTVTNPPHIDSVSPDRGAPGRTITISGTGFGPQQDRAGMAGQHLRRRSELERHANHRDGRARFPLGNGQGPPKWSLVECREL